MSSAEIRSIAAERQVRLHPQQFSESLLDCAEIIALCEGCQIFSATSCA
jgi:hypothetical protein